MSKREIQIIVCGNSCSGKSTMMYEIQQLLQQRGYNVDISLEGNLDYKDKKDYFAKMLKNREQRVEILTKEAKITMKEMQLNRAIKESKKVEKESNNHN